MNIIEAQRLVNEYTSWLKDRTVLREVKDYVEVTTPFMDRHNDHIQLYISKVNDNLYITDDGYTLNDLYSTGFDLSSSKRKQLLDLTLNGLGVERNGNELRVNTDEKSFPRKKHCLIQAILSVNDLFYLSSPYTTSLFLEDVKSWLDKNDVRYIQNVSFTGKTGFSHNYDFVVPKSRIQPERILRIINHPERQIIEYILFSWHDTLVIREPNSRLYAIINDQNEVKPKIADALERYEVRGLLWSKRDEYKEELVA